MLKGNLGTVHCAGRPAKSRRWGPNVCGWNRKRKHKLQTYIGDNTTEYKNTYGDKTRVDCWKVGREGREVTIPLLALLENRQQYLKEILFGNTRYYAV